MTKKKATRSPRAKGGTAALARSTPHVTGHRLPCGCLSGFAPEYACKIHSGCMLAHDLRKEQQPLPGEFDPPPTLALDYERLECERCGQHRDANVHLKQHGYSNYHEYRAPAPIVAGHRKPAKKVYSTTGLARGYSDFKPHSGNVADYFEAAFECGLSPKSRDSLADCPLVSVCGIACREAIDAGRTLLKSLRATLGEGNEHEAALVSAVLTVCQVIYCG